MPINLEDVPCPKCKEAGGIELSIPIEGKKKYHCRWCGQWWIEVSEERAQQTLSRLKKRNKREEAEKDRKLSDYLHRYVYGGGSRVIEDTNIERIVERLRKLRDGL